MAATKQTSKTTKKATEVQTIEQLQETLAGKQADQLQARRGHAAGELANPRALTVLRKEIARLHTAIRAAELAQKENK